MIAQSSTAHSNLSLADVGHGHGTDGTVWHGIGTAWYRRDMMGDVVGCTMYGLFHPAWRLLEALEHKNLRCRAVGGKHCLIDEMVVADIQTYGV
jgi:hypothetical protein